MLRFLLVGVLMLAALPVAAQDDCAFDFSDVIPMLQSATTLDEVAAARAQIELQEAQCRDANTSSAGDSRTNPVAFGDIGPAIADDYDASIQILGYIDDGEETLLKANDRNPPASEGKRYVLIPFQFTCDRTPDQSCEYSPIHFSIVGDKGIAYRFDTVKLRSGSISEKQEIFGGASITVGVAFLVDDDDHHFVLFTEYGDPRTYFATE